MKKIVCRRCGSDEVSFDATARWNPAAQEFELTAVHDGDACDQCDAGRTEERDMTQAEIDALAPKFDADKEDGWNTNGARAANAEAAIDAANSSRGDSIAGVSDESVTDLLTDLLHLCDREGISAELMVNRALMNWRAER